jgi:3D (Asp-Asp-Asp) domain-containing protein
MILAASHWRKLIVTALAAGSFVALYEVTILDSQRAPWSPRAVIDGLPPEPGALLSFTATAYCKGLVTAAGVVAQTGVAASDPAMLPLGSIVEVEVGNPRYDGMYSIVDTGPSVQGSEIDIYMWSCHEALRFGRQPARVTVLRLGWNPRATRQSLMQRLFNRPEPALEPAPLPSRPLPSVRPTPSEAENEPIPSLVPSP